ncbi:MAG: NeuD/PglB/VioB family sugar acetyltransferase [Candidatus Omnitrophota bacterium]|nr:NeuD/PglB/VioB family sugar acetyltransferase [Candidatus Omnitrophota bacterium]
MLKNILLFPFGGNARESLNSIFAINNINKEWNVIGFIDSNRSIWGKTCCAVEVKGDKEILRKFAGVYVLAVPGNPGNYLQRSEIIASLGIKKSQFATIIDPHVVLSPDSKIGYNTLLMPNVVIGCGVKIGNHCIVLSNTVIAHDSTVGDYCCIGSNVSISGNVVVGAKCYIGSGVSIRNNVRIGGGSLIGIGSNVVSDIEENIVAVGNPAKALRKSNLK